MYFDKAFGKYTDLDRVKLVRYWHRPAGGVVEVIQKMKEKAVHDPALLGNKYFELFVGSIWAMGLQKSEKSDLWIAKPEDDPPDLYFMTMVTDSKNKTRFHCREIEITRWIDGNDSLENAILAKDRPGYPADYVLVCYILASGLADFKKLSDNLQTKLCYIKHVFLVFHGVMLDQISDARLPTGLPWQINVIQLSPQYSHQPYDFREVWKVAMEDGQRLAYVENGKIYVGIRKEDKSVFPKIIK